LKSGFEPREGHFCESGAVESDNGRSRQAQGVLKKNLKNLKKNLALAVQGVYNTIIVYMFFSSNLILVCEIAI
jgi:hypothetical protein